MALRPDSSYGRYISPELGRLTGEAAGQRIGAHRSGLMPPSALANEEATYYGLPVLKAGVWTWDIPAYYYLGGLSGAAAALGGAATLWRRREMPTLALGGRAIAVAGGALSTYFLIHDLGRPERFLYMMRVFRPSSPMNVGAWLLASFATASTASLAGAFVSSSGWRGRARRALEALHLKRRPFLERGSDILAVVAGILGLPMTGYTGVLVSNTVVPLWQAPRRLMPLLFMASAAASAGSAFELAALKPQEVAAVQRFAVAGKAAELIAAEALEREVGRVPRVAEPLRTGLSGTLWKAGQGLGLAALGCSLLGRRSPTLRRVGGVLGTASALCLRFGIHYAGQRSARDPRATFEQQRAGYGAYEALGRAAVTRPDRDREPRS